MCLFHWSVLQRVWLIVCIINFAVWISIVTKELLDHNGSLNLKQIFYILSRFLLEFLSCYAILGYAIYARSWMYTKPGVALEGGLLLYYLLRYSPWEGGNGRIGPILFHNYFELAQILSTASFWCLSAYCIIKFYFFSSTNENGFEVDENSENGDRERRHCGDDNRIIFESDYIMIAQCQKLNPNPYHHARSGENCNSYKKFVSGGSGLQTVLALANGGGCNNEPHGGSTPIPIPAAVSGRGVTSTNYNTEYPIGDYGSMLQYSPQVPLSSFALPLVLPPVPTTSSCITTGNNNNSGTIPTSHTSRARTMAPTCSSAVPASVIGRDRALLSRHQQNNNHQQQKLNLPPKTSSSSNFGSGLGSNTSSLRSYRNSKNNNDNKPSNGGSRFAQSLRR